MIYKAPKSEWTESETCPNSTSFLRQMTSTTLSSVHLLLCSINILGLESIEQYCDIDWKSWPLWYRKQSAPDDIVSPGILPCAPAMPLSVCDLHQNDTRIGCLVARQTTNHWAHASVSGWYRPTLTAAVINASILVVLSRCWAGPLPAWLHPTISRYHDTLAYDIAIHFFLTIRALQYSRLCLLLSGRLSVTTVVFTVLYHFDH